MPDLSFDGSAAYEADRVTRWGRVFVAVPWRVQGSTEDVVALLDTAAEWCVVSADLGAKLGIVAEEGDPSATMLTRHGRIDGRVVRVPVQLVADEGSDVTVEATFVVSADWPALPVIGWKGLLERVRLGLDPSSQRVYFSSTS